ncbi:tRNA lysidine(34) synthetase TilS [soil metagenome]
MTGVGAASLGRRFALHLQASGLLSDVERPLVALSGGLDSVCLLHLLRFAVTPVAVEAAHFDHAMRPDSGADADWVRGLCTAWRVPLALGRAERPPRSEAAARDMRYAFLHEAAERIGAGAILTAHHADDQAETVLFRLARGTGLTGLAGIPARRGLIARPLLPFTRAELRAYAHACGLRWREDVSNRSLRFARNRIRHTVLPALESTRPGAARRIARLAERAAEAESAWQAVTRTAVADALVERFPSGYALARDRMLAYHPHVRARVIRHLLNELGSRPGRSGTRAAVEFISSGASGSGIEIAGGVRLEREFGRIVIRLRLDAVTVDRPLIIRAAAPGSGSFVAGGQRYVAQWAPTPRGAETRHTAAFDPSSLQFPLELRSWRPGDRIRLQYGRKKLKKLLQEQRIGRADRARAAILCDAGGSVLWVVGVARSVEARPAPGPSVFTLTVLHGESL